MIDTCHTNKYDVEYILNGGTNSSSNPAKYTHGVEVVLENASKDDLNAIFNDEEFDQKYQNSIIKNKILSLREGI